MSLSMSKIVKFPVHQPPKLGPKKARRRRKPNLEDYGQLNLFEQAFKEVKIINLPQHSDFFEEALRLDEMDDPEAEKYYLLAVENNQSKADAFCNLGILKSQQNDLSKSIDYLTKCLEINPRHFEAHYNLANVYSDMGNLFLSKTHYEVSIQIDSEFSDSYYNLGLVLISLKKFDEAIKIIDKYIQLTPEADHKSATELIRALKALG